MCEKIDVDVKLCCTSTKIFLWVVGIGMIVLGIIVLVLGIVGNQIWAGGLYMVALGIGSIVAIFYSPKWVIISMLLNHVVISFCCVAMTIIFLFFSLFFGDTDENKEKKVKTNFTILYVLGSFCLVSCVFAITGLVVYCKILYNKGGANTSVSGTGTVTVSLG
ncbi:unnamed protein product [Caenorhabditis angaria]|uniref:Transmembrane protein n=1 Tax=Caenorhabditis angaria TaxID=860376 RepID=A0A9P1IKM0_9PELO|nr:unnamed protein product [Caenorhabditis angaria]